MSGIIRKKEPGEAWESVPDTGGGSGGGFDYVQADDPGAVGAGKTWLQTSTLAGIPVWQALTAYTNNDLVQPTIANGHVYQAVDVVTSGADEPDWQTNGDPTPDGDGDWGDTGLAATGAQGWIRDDTDVQWGSISLLLDGDAVIRGRLWFSDDDNELLLEFLDTDGALVARLVLSGTTSALSGTGQVDMDLLGFGHATLYRGPTVDRGTALSLHAGAVDGGEGEFNFAYGDIDPSAGLGLTMAPGSMFSRTVDPDTAELWFKTGSGDTDWTEITP